jgi:hypothetical protein
VLLDNPHLLRDDVQRLMLARYRRELVGGVKTVSYAPAAHGQRKNGPCFYHDIDVRNCHPVSLLQLCGFSGVPHLRRYVTEREECLQAVMSSCGVNRDAAKELFLRHL